MEATVGKRAWSHYRSDIAYEDGLPGQGRLRHAPRRQKSRQDQQLEQKHRSYHGNRGAQLGICKEQMKDTQERAQFKHLPGLEGM